MTGTTSVIRSEVGDLIPRQQVELRSNVRLATGCIVRGGIVCGRLDVSEGDVLVEGAVHAIEECIITATTAEIRLDAPVCSRGAVTAAASGDASIVFSADVCAPRINLTRCIVWGSLLAKNLVLNDCVVLGHVSAAERLTLRNSYVGSMSAAQALVSGVVIVGAGACMCESPVMGDDASVYSAAFVDYNQLANGEPVDLIEVERDDVQCVVLEEGEGVRKQLWFYSLASRMMDATGLQEIAERNRTILSSAGLARHIHPNEVNEHSIDLSRIVAGIRSSLDHYLDRAGDRARSPIR